MSDVVTIAKNLINVQPSPIASGTISFATGATAATIVSAEITTPSYPVSQYLYVLRSNATQTTIDVEINNVRSFFSTSTAFKLTSITLNTADKIDRIVEGSFCGNATGVRLRFSLGTAATGSEIVSADYQVWPLR